VDSTDKENRYCVVEDPFLTDMPWKDVSVDSSAFRALKYHVRLYELAQAFLRAAMVVCREAGESGRTSWPIGSACYSNLYHATELFLKACIGSRDESAVRIVHEIAELRRKYAEMFPGEPYFFHTPWYVSAGDLSSVFGHEILSGVDKKPDQLYRYSADCSGTPSEGIQVFTPGYLFNYMRYLQDRWAAVWNLIAPVGG
jgi:hypothetical protein